MLKEQLLKIKEQLGLSRGNAEGDYVNQDSCNKRENSEHKAKRKQRGSSPSPGCNKPLMTKSKADSRKINKKSKNAERQQKKKLSARESVSKSNKKKKRKASITYEASPLVLISDLPSSKGKKVLFQSKKVEKKYSIPTAFTSDRKGLWDFHGVAEDFVLQRDRTSEGQVPKKELVLGLDFGTAYTKVVVADETYAYPVKFEGADYLLPSELYLRDDGCFTLFKQDSKHVFSKLKHPLLFSSSTEDDEIVLVAFLSLVFKSTRSWVSTSPFRNNKIDWLVNAGLATDSYHDAELKDKFGELVNLAWNVSYLAKLTPTLIKDQIKESKQLTNELEGIHSTLPNDCLSVFPEYVAQISGYMNSPSKRDYSHLLIDVGAGTLDIVMFTTKNIDGEWRYSTNAKSISNLGADILKSHRQQYAPEKGLSLSLLSKNIEVASRLSISPEELGLLDREFAQAVNLNLRNVIAKVAGGYKFGVDITTFICGGGREIEFYQKQLEVLNNYPIDRIDLPSPSRFQPPKDFDMSKFHRFSVALGLSYDPFNIGECEVNNVGAKTPIAEYTPSQYILNPK